MRWIKKMTITFYDGHDELYHHAKFGEDRTMRAGCRRENMVFRAWTVDVHLYKKNFRTTLPSANSKCRISYR